MSESIKGEESFKKSKVTFKISHPFLSLGTFVELAGEVEDDGCTSMSIAGRMGDVETLRALVELDMDFTLQTCDRLLHVLFAAIEGEVGVLRVLVEWGLIL